MPKKYPWQRWPEKKKDGKQSDYNGQTSDPSWKKSSIQDLTKEEKKASKDYAKMSKTAPTKKDAKTLKTMSRDEARHAKNLKKVEPMHRTRETYTYHGRKGHPEVHRTETGEEYIMVRAKGGGTKRLYLTPETKRKLESKEGY